MLGGSRYVLKSTTVRHGRTTVRPRRIRQRTIDGAEREKAQAPGGEGGGGVSKAFAIRFTEPLMRPGRARCPTPSTSIPATVGDVVSMYGASPPGRSGLT